jgi:tetratricopeptide (TPR) repeat protein
VEKPLEDHWIDQLRALAWAHLANAYRVHGDLPAADQTLEKADAFWDAGTRTIGDALGYEPVLLNLKASLRIAQRRFEEALGLLEEAVELYLSQDPVLRDPHLAGRSLIQKAGALVEMGEMEAAIAALREAEALVQPDREPRLFFNLRHNLMDHLSSAGRHAEAKALLPEVWALAEHHANHLDRLRIRWVESRILAGLGDRDRAWQALLTVRTELIAEAIPYDAALATLELAVLYLEEGNVSEVKALASEMVAVFREQEVPREALASLLAFQRAAALETATVDLAREVAAFLERGRRERHAT